MFATPQTSKNSLFRLIILSVVVSVAPASATSTVSRDPKLIEAGQALARAECSRCHGIGRTDESPLEQAPPFRRLHQRYPIEHLAEAFAEGIVVGHTEMPAFQLDPAQIDALLAYLASLERRRRN